MDIDGREKDFGLSYRTDGALEYKLTNDITVSVGYSYYNSGIKNEKRSEIDPLLNSHTIGAGFALQIDNMLTIN